MTRPSSQPDVALVWLLLAAGMIARLALAPLAAHPGDFATLTRWASALRTYPLLDVYQVTDANYPPLAMALLGVSGWLHGLVAPGDLSGPVWMILLKLPAILADAGISWTVWRIAARHGGSTWNLAAIIFNPALIYLSAWWGQYESVYVLAALAAVVNALDSHFFRAGLWLGAGLMVKLQAGMVVPVLLMALVTVQQPRLPISHRMVRLISGFVLAVLICLGPYALDGQLATVLLRLVALVSGPGWLTVNALNFWYLVTGGAGNWGYNAPLVMPDSSTVLAGLSARDLGLILLAVWLIGVLWISVERNHRDGSLRAATIFQATALLYVGVFLWSTQAHERYAFGAVVLMAAATAWGNEEGLWRPAVLVSYVGLTVLHTLNLIWAAPFNPALEGWFAGNQPAGMVITAGFMVVGLWSLASLKSRPA